MDGLAVPPGLRVEFDRVSRLYGGRRVLSRFSAAAEGGSVVAVTGPNGAGKSTLLRLLLGLARPSAGATRLALGGRWLDLPARRAVAGYLAPDAALYDDLTAGENLRLIGRLRGMDRAAAAARAAALLDEVGLSGRADGRLATFSSGMRQRVRLAAALLHRPPLLVLDEPGTNLDEAGRALVARAVADCREAGGLVLLATNDPREAALADQEWSLERPARAAA